MGLKAPIDFNTVDEDNVQGGISGSVAPGENESLKYADINPTLKSKADAIIPFYGEETAVKIFHRRWQFRDEGVKKLVSDMSEVFAKSNEENTLAALNSAVINTIVEVMKDKVQQIIILSFDAGEEYIRQMQQYPQLTTRSDQGAFERMLCQMLDRLTD